MKAIHTDKGYKIEKGKTILYIIPGLDRPYRPVQIDFENKRYNSRYGLIDTLNMFKNCYSEEQVIETLINLTIG